MTESSSHYAIYALDKPGLLAVRERQREAHRSYIRMPTPDGVQTVLGGPLLDDSGSMNGTLLVVTAPSRDAVERFVAADPYQRHGLFERVEIRLWRWGLSVPNSAAAPP